MKKNRGFTLVELLVIIAIIAILAAIALAVLGSQTRQGRDASMVATLSQTKLDAFWWRQDGGEWAGICDDLFKSDDDAITERYRDNKDQKQYNNYACHSGDFGYIMWGKSSTGKIWCTDQSGEVREIQEEPWFKANEWDFSDEPDIDCHGEDLDN